MFQFSMPKVHPHKHAIESAGLRFMGGMPYLGLKPHINGRLQVMHNGQWIATIIPHFLDDGEECGTGGEPYELLSHPDSNETYRGDAGYLAQILSVLQQTNGDWEKVGECTFYR